MTSASMSCKRSSERLSSIVSIGIVGLIALPHSPVLTLRCKAISMPWAVASAFRAVT